MKGNDHARISLGAAAGDDVVLLRKMLRDDPDLVRDPRLLNAAALTGSSAAAGILLQSGADPDGQVASHEKYRPLHRAIEHRGVKRNAGHAKVIEMLLSAGASLSKRATWMQLTPLAVAGMAGEQEFVELLKTQGVPESIFTAAITADVNAVRRFIKNEPSMAVAKDENGMTVLHYSALSGLVGDVIDAKHRKIAIILLDAGADGNSKEPIGPYPPTPVLHFAAWKNYAVAETLLQRGCNPNYGFGNCLWRTPTKMAELFLAHGADVNGRDDKGMPFLNSRIHWNLPSVALWLLKNGADPNATDQDGNTALHEGARRGINMDVIAALVDNGCRTDARNKYGDTPLDLARVKKRANIVTYLQKFRPTTKTTPK